MEGSTATAEALIEAGRELFARHGYDGTSVRALTTRAGVNLGAVTYHFGSKRALYDRVVERCVLPLVERVEAVAAASGDPLERVEAVVRTYFDYLRETPELPQLMMQQLVVGKLPPQAAVGPMRRMQAALLELVRQGQEAGRIRQGHPPFLAFSIVSQPIHLSLVRRAFGMLTGRDMEDAEARRAIVDHVVRFTRAGLEARPETEGRE